MSARDRTVAGPRSALDVLYEREHAPMVRLAHLLTGSPAAAEDIVHDAFVRLALRIDEVRQPGAYLRTSVVNGCRSHHRRAATVRDHPVEPPASYLPGPLVEFADALRHLPERQRTAIVLRFYCDLPDEEIAAHLGCRRSTVRVLVHRALGRLREVIEP